MDRIKREEFWKWIPMKGLFFTWLTNSFMLVTVTLYKNYIWWAKYVIGKIAIRCWQYWEKNISHWKLSLCAHVGMPNLLWITSALLFFVTHSAYHCKYSYYNSFLNMTIKFQTKTVHVPSIDPFISVKKPNIKLILLQVVMKISVNMESFFKL